MVYGQMNSLQQRTEYRYATQRNQQPLKQPALHDSRVADASNKGWAGCGNGLQITWCMYVCIYIILLFMTTTDFRYVTWLTQDQFSAPLEIETVVERNSN